MQFKMDTNPAADAIKTVADVAASVLKSADLPVTDENVARLTGAFRYSPTDPSDEFVVKMRQFAAVYETLQGFRWETQESLAA